MGGIGLATQFEHLWLCRLLTGAGVAALSTAATLSIADISTPLNRASTMAPIMSAFAAGIALGPALGGYLADAIGIHPTFYLVGLCYFGLTAVNHLLLTETKAAQMIFPWQDETILQDPNVHKQSIKEAVRDAVGQWAPLMADARVRNVVIMNGFYWTALAGSQMTLLPLMLTDPSGLAMTATGVGQVYMGMSAIQGKCVLYCMGIKLVCCWINISVHYAILTHSYSRLFHLTSVWQSHTRQICGSNRKRTCHCGW